MVLSVAKDWALATGAVSTEYSTSQQGGGLLGISQIMQQWVTAREAAIGDQLLGLLQCEISV